MILSSFPSSQHILVLFWGYFVMKTFLKITKISWKSYFWGENLEGNYYKGGYIIFLHRKILNGKWFMVSQSQHIWQNLMIFYRKWPKWVKFTFFGILEEWEHIKSPKWNMLLKKISFANVWWWFLKISFFGQFSVNFLIVTISFFA